MCGGIFARALAGKAPIIQGLRLDHGLLSVARRLRLTHKGSHFFGDSPFFIDPGDPCPWAYLVSSHWIWVSYALD